MNAFEEACKIAREHKEKITPKPSVSAYFDSIAALQELEAMQVQEWFKNTYFGDEHPWAAPVQVDYDIWLQDESTWFGEAMCPNTGRTYFACSSDYDWVKVEMEEWLNRQDGDSDIF